MTVIRKYHNHTLQTNPRHRDEEPQNINSHKTTGINLSKATSSLPLFPIKMIAKLEITPSTAHQNRDITQNPINNWSTNKQRITNNRVTRRFKPHIQIYINITKKDTLYDSVKRIKVLNISAPEDG